VKNTHFLRVPVAVVVLSGLLAAVGCYPSHYMVVHTVVSCPPLPDTAVFILLDRAAKAPGFGAVKIGRVGFGLRWDRWYHDRIFDSLRTAALRHGANLATVIRHGQPNARFGESVAADLWRVPDVQQYNYSDVRDWVSHRRLRFDDFKFRGPVLGDPSIGESRGAYTLGAIATIRCAASWINRASNDSVALLLHEQGLFDLLEVYCRQYRDWIHGGNMPYGYFDQVERAWVEKQSEYEWQTRHGLDSARQAEWTAKIDHALVVGTDGIEAEFRVVAVK
jgi:hypothetical protein